MSALDREIYELGQLDQLSYQDTPIHRLDPRAKVITTMVFLVCVVSFDKYAVLPLLPFALFPVAMVARGDLPAQLLLRKLLVVAPFAVVVGMFNPWFDPEIVLELGPLSISAGWISYLSILLRFALTTFAALALIATTSFTAICMALERMGVPDVLATQLLFLYRYLFVLAEETQRMSRARALRTVGSRSLSMGTYSNLLGHLLIRTHARAQRIYLAMLCRGFDGRVRITRTIHFERRDVVFTLGWSATFVLFRLYNVPLLLGHLVTGLIS